MAEDTKRTSIPKAEAEQIYSPILEEYATLSSKKLYPDFF